MSKDAKDWTENKKVLCMSELSVPDTGRKYTMES